MDNIFKMVKEKRTMTEFNTIKIDEQLKLSKHYFKAGRKEALQEEIEYILWLLEHKGKGYTTAFYENSLGERLNKLRCKLLLLPEEKKQ